MRKLVWNQQMRVKLSGELGKVYPENCQVNMDYYMKRCRQLGLINLEFRIDGLPMSLNHQHEMGTKYCKPGTPGAFQDGKGKWRVRSNRLKPRVMDWRLIVMETMGAARFEWRPTGVTAAILLFESNEWLHKNRKVRAKDADNLAKPAFDAIQFATETPDDLHWEFHVYKVLAQRPRTTVMLFDLGDVVDFYR